MTTPNLDLTFERTTKLTPEQLWKGWTDPETIVKWFCPRPWRVSFARVNLKPGGEFFTIMEGPNGERMENHGCFLEVVENKKLTWTNVMSEGFRPLPASSMGFPFVATIQFEKSGNSTHYFAKAQHADEENRNTHAKMGFQEGWGAALKQLEELFL